MKKISFINKANKIDIVFDKYKIIICEDANTYWSLIGAIKQYIENIKLSEYSENRNYEYNILINDDKTDKTTDIYVINYWNDFEENLKFKTNTVINKVLEKVVRDKMYSDEYLQVNSLLRKFIESLSFESVKFDMPDIDARILSKFINVELINDNEQMNTIDCSYYDYVKLQIELIKKINPISKNVLLIIDIPYLSKQIFDLIVDCGLEIVVVCQKIKDLIVNETEKISINGIDIENKIDLYERMNNMTNYYDIEEYIKALKNKYLVSCR